LARKRNLNYPPVKRKFGNKWYVYDRYSKRGVKGKKSLQRIGRAGVKNRAIKGYRVVPSRSARGTYFLYVRY